MCSSDLPVYLKYVKFFDVAKTPLLSSWSVRFDDECWFRPPSEHLAGVVLEGDFQGEELDRGLRSSTQVACN